MERVSGHRKLIGWAVVVMVSLGVVVPQLLGIPDTDGHIAKFIWTHGYPCVYMYRYGTKPNPKTIGPSPLRDKSDSHYTTRLLVPMPSVSDKYPARTGILPIPTTDVYRFDHCCLLANILYGMLLIGAAVHVKRRMAVKPACVAAVRWVMAALLVLCLALYVQIIMTLGDSLFVVLYKPPLVAFSILGAYCVGVAIWSLVEALWRISWRRSDRNMEGN